MQLIAIIAAALAIVGSRGSVALPRSELGQASDVFEDGHDVSWASEDGGTVEEISVDGKDDLWNERTAVDEDFNDFDAAIEQEIKQKELGMVAGELFPNSVLENFIRLLIEKLRSHLRAVEPIVIPDMTNRSFHTDSIDLFFSLTDVHMSNLSSFQVKQLSSDVFRMTLEAQFLLPQFWVTGRYQLNGTAIKTAVKGAGQFMVKVGNLKASVKMKGKLVRGYPQIDRLKLDYEFESMEIRCSGLQVEGYTQEEIDNFMAQVVPAMIRDLEETVCSSASDEIVRIINEMLHHITLKELIAWLKHFGSEQFLPSLGLKPML